MTRQCDRPGCADPAVSTLGYEYAQSTVWLVDLTADGHPATYDLCLFHADALTVPIGWELRDRRGDAVAQVDPATEARAV